MELYLGFWFESNY